MEPTHFFDFTPIEGGMTDLPRVPLPISFAVTPGGDLPRRARVEATGFLALLPGDTEQRTIVQTKGSDFLANQALGFAMRIDEELNARRAAPAREVSASISTFQESQSTASDAGTVSKSSARTATPS